MLTEPLLAGLVLHDTGVTSLNHSRLVGLGVLGRGGGASADGGVSLGVNGGDVGTAGLLNGGFPLAELALEVIGALLL
jgi:hypothetical protein